MVKHVPGVHEFWSSKSWAG